MKYVLAIDVAKNKSILKDYYFFIVFDLTNNNLIAIIVP